MSSFPYHACHCVLLKQGVNIMDDGRGHLKYIIVVSSFSSKCEHIEPPGVDGSLFFWTTVRVMSFISQVSILVYMQLSNMSSSYSSYN